MKRLTKLMAIPLVAALMGVPLANDADAAVFVSVGAAPVYYYPPAPVYAPAPAQPSAYAPPQYVVAQPQVVYAAPAVVSPVFIGGGYYRYGYGYRHYWR